MKKRGYLLLEMMISLAIITIFTFAIARIQGQIAIWHHQAEQYLMAATIAQEILAYLPNAIPKTHTKQGFTIDIQSMPLEPDIPYKLHTITVSFCTLQGVKRQFILYGGTING